MLSSSSALITLAVLCAATRAEYSQFFPQQQQQQQQGYYGQVPQPMPMQPVPAGDNSACMPPMAPPQEQPQQNFQVQLVQQEQQIQQEQQVEQEQEAQKVQSWSSYEQRPVYAPYRRRHRLYEPRQMPPVFAVQQAREQCVPPPPAPVQDQCPTKFPQQQQQQIFIGGARAVAEENAEGAENEDEYDQDQAGEEGEEQWPYYRPYGYGYGYGYGRNYSPYGGFYRQPYRPYRPYPYYRPRFFGGDRSF